MLGVGVLVLGEVGAGAGVVAGDCAVGGVVGWAGVGVGCATGGVDCVALGGVLAGGACVDWAMAIGVANRKAAAATTSMRFMKIPPRRTFPGPAHQRRRAAAGFRLVSYDSASFPRAGAFLSPPRRA